MWSSYSMVVKFRSPSDKMGRLTNWLENATSETWCMVKLSSQGAAIANLGLSWYSPSPPTKPLERGSPFSSPVSQFTPTGIPHLYDCFPALVTNIALVGWSNRRKLVSLKLGCWWTLYMRTRFCRRTRSWNGQFFSLVLRLSRVMVLMYKQSCNSTYS